jgi:uncharacterized protein YbbK (DUF523 family)
MTTTTITRRSIFFSLLFNPFLLRLFVMIPAHVAQRINQKKCLVSSCLTGLCTRYDGCSRPDTACLQILQNYLYIPVCPEQLGGLATPRTAADLVGGNGADVLAGRAAVIDRNGIDVSRQFIAGARAVLKIARDQDIGLALLKENSPSCGLKPITGVTAALLREHNIEIIPF